MAGGVVPRCAPMTRHGSICSVPAPDARIGPTEPGVGLRTQMLDQADWVPVAAGVLERGVADVEAAAGTTSFVALGGTSMRAIAFAAELSARGRRLDVA